MELQNVGRTFLIAGVVLAGIGAFLLLGDKFPFFGRLPGDISLRWGGGWFYFPLVTCLLLSVLLTIGLNIIMRIMNRS